MGQKFVIIKDSARDLAGIKSKLEEKIPGCEVLNADPDSAAPADATCVFISVENPAFDDVLKNYKARSPDAIFIAIIFSDTPYKFASKAISSDNYKYIEYPVDFDKFAEIFKAITSTPEKKDKYGIIGSSASIKSVHNFIEKAAGCSLSVLIEGESGTGKELVANAIHNRSARSDKPFIAINCAAFPKDLVENELFGHESGAFTGAAGVKKGLFEIADRGTLFIDEIGEMDLNSQTKLLRVLETGKFRRLGGTVELESDVRIVAATNKVLENEIQSGKFRLDLFYRLCILRLFIAPLRERWNDIPEIIEHFLKAGKYQKKFSPEALEAMQDYSWPGNIRELKNAVDRAATFASGSVMNTGDLPEHIVRQLKSKPEINTDFDESLASFVENMEKELLLRALEKFDGKKSEIAKALKISRFTLYRKLEKYGIA